MPKARITFIAACTVLVSGVIGARLLYSSPTEMSTVTINGATVRVDVADTPRERAQGLSGRRSLPRHNGMLFVFDKPGTPHFHMKDMKFSIDIIWLDQNRTVVDITRAVSPETYPERFTPQQPVLYVLEVPAGYSNTKDITIGDSAVFNIK